MAYPKLLEVARILFEKTENGEINWEATANDNVYQAPLSKYSTLIERNIDEESDRPYHQLKICNEEGREIEVLSSWEASTEGDVDLRALFELARRKAMGVEKALDEVLIALRKAS